MYAVFPMDRIGPTDGRSPFTVHRTTTTTTTTTMRCARLSTSTTTTTTTSRRGNDGRAMNARRAGGGGGGRRRAIRDPREDTSDESGSLPLETRADRDGGASASAASAAAERKSARKVSVEVQRALARRVLEAQRGWLSSKESAALGELESETRGEALQSDPELVGVVPEAYMRVRWLLGLLILQSTSSLVLSRYADLIKENIVVTLFLTMLVGAGGNAGNQSAIHVIRGLATGEMDDSAECLRKTLSEQFQVGLLLGAALSTAGFVRVLLTSPEGASDLVGPLAIATSLFAIVTTSTCVGTVLPFLLMKLKQDPANAGTTVQVIMDVSGVVITCTVASFIFSHAQEWGISV